MQELREAQDYIAYLQEELRAISDVVVQLREPPDDVARYARVFGVQPNLLVPQLTECQGRIFYSAEPTFLTAQKRPISPYLLGQ